MRPKPDGKQQPLLFRRSEKMDLIRDGIAAIESIGAVAKRNLTSLLTQLELCTFSDGCNVRQSVLTGRTGLPRRTLQRCIGLAEQLGIVRVDRQRIKRTGGQGPSGYTIVWDELAAQVRGCQPSADGEKVAHRSAKMALRCANLAQRSLEKTSEDSAPAHTPARSFSSSYSTPPMTSHDTAIPETIEIPVMMAVDRRCQSATAAEQCDEEEEGFYKLLEKRLEALHMGAPHLAIFDARQRGARATEVSALIDHWSSKAGAWEIGALFRRIQRAGCGMPIESGWPTASEEFLKRRRGDARRAAEEKQSRDSEHERQRCENEQAADRQFESRFAPLLEQMTQDQLSHLAAKVFATNPILMKRFRDHGIQATDVRLCLMTELAKSNATVNLMDPR